MRSSAIRWWVAATVPLASGPAGCDRSHDGDEQPTGSTDTAPASASPAAAPQPVDPERLAREARAAMEHLERAIAANERRLEHDPQSLEAREGLIGLLLRRARMLGKVSDFERIERLGAEVVELRPERGASYTVRARVHASLHRFDEALEDLERAEQLGVSPEDTRSQRGTIALGRGELPKAHRLLHRHRKKYEGSRTLVLEAVALGRLGRFDEADALFERAKREARAPSPFEAAWMQFEQAIMWDRADKVERARAGYRRTTRILPHHAHAAAHLAPSLDPDEAASLLSRVLEVADDPEIMVQLAEVRERIEPGSAEALRTKADEAYDALVDEHPLAFADHAGWYYLSTGQLDRAVELAEQNLDVRRVPEAYQLAIAALIRAGESDEACRRAEQALALPHRGPHLMSAVRRAFSGCGMGQRAAEL